MSMKTLSAKALAMTSLVALAACSGGGTADDPVVTLSDTSNTDAIDVTLISSAGTASDQTFNAVDGEVTSGGAVEAALIGGVNAGLDFVRITDTGSVVILASENPRSAGSATYNGQATVFVTDVASSTSYDGTADASIAVDLDGGSATINYTDFTGTQQVGIGAPTAATGGSIAIEGIAATAAGLSGGDAPTATGFGGADFTGATTVVNGLFGGPDSAEIGGVATSNGAAGTLNSTFVGAR